MPTQNNNNKRQDNEISTLRKCVYDHIAKFNEELGGVKVDIVAVKTDVNWLKRSYWVIATASIGALAGAIINLILK